MAEEAEDANEDIDADTEGEGGEGEKKKGGLKKLILFIGLPAIIVVLGGVAGALMFMGGGDEAELTELDSEYGEAAGGASATPVPVELHESMPVTMVVTFDAGGNAESRMSIGIVLVSADPIVTEWTERDDVPTALTDTYLEFLRTLRVEDVNGSMGTFRLRSELLRRSNLVLAPATVEQVLITELLIQ